MISGSIMGSLIYPLSGVSSLSPLPRWGSLVQGSRFKVKGERARVRVRENLISSPLPLITVPRARSINHFFKDLTVQRRPITGWKPVPLSRLLLSHGRHKIKAPQSSWVSSPAFRSPNLRKRAWQPREIGFQKP